MAHAGMEDGGHRVGASYQHGLSRTEQDRGVILTSHNTANVHREVHCRSLPRATRGYSSWFMQASCAVPGKGGVDCQGGPAGLTRLDAPTLYASSGRPVCTRPSFPANSLLVSEHEATAKMAITGVMDVKSLLEQFQASKSRVQQLKTKVAES